MTNIAQIVPRLTSQLSGPTHSVPLLCDGLTVHNHNVTLLSLAPYPSITTSNNLRRITFKEEFGHNQLGFSVSFHKFSISNSSFDIVHNHGLWLLPVLYSHNLLHLATVL